MDKSRRTEVREGFVFAFLLGAVAGILCILLVGGKIVIGDFTLKWEETKTKAGKVAKEYKKELEEKLRRK